jgi:C-terminal processing protease CtpA/Prc
MFLRPGQQSARAFEFDMAGLVLQARRDGALTVLDVIADSPAGRAGAESGDILVAVDGQDVRSLGNERTLGLLRTPGRTVVLTLERSGRQMTRRVTLARLI